jgi:RNA polymerase sigma-70 factor (ECF subfamily)
VLRVPEKFSNIPDRSMVFSYRSRRVVAGTVTVDEALTRQQTSEELLEAAVYEHSRLVFRIAYSVLRNHHDAEDATQETFIKVLRQSRKLKQVENLRAWLARIAWRVAVDRYKKTSHVAMDDLERAGADLRSSEVAADDAVQGMQLNAMLETMIGSLPSKLRGPLVLSTVEELSPSDVAKVLGITEAAVRSRLFRARQILKEKLMQRAIRK